MLWTFFHGAYGMPSGPRAEEGEDLLRTCLISSAVRGLARGFLLEVGVQEGFVAGDQVGSTCAEGVSRLLSWGEKRFGRPHVLGGCLGKEIRPVGSIGPLDGLEVP